jgi:hypothetical protein
VGVVVHVFQVGLMHVLMGVRGPVLVRVGVLMRHVVVLVRGVRVGVSFAVMFVFVRVRCVVGVLLAHGDPS